MFFLCVNGYGNDEGKKPFCAQSLRFKRERFDFDRFCEASNVFDLTDINWPLSVLNFDQTLFSRLKFYWSGVDESLFGVRIAWSYEETKNVKPMEQVH